MYARTWALHIMCVNTNICVVSMCVYEYCAWCVHTIRATLLQFIYLTYDYFTWVIWQLRKISTTDEIVYDCVMYMCTFIYADICVYVFVWVCTYTYASIFRLSSLAQQNDLRLYMYVDIYIFRISTLARQNISELQTYIHSYIHMYIYVYTHTHTHISIYKCTHVHNTFVHNLVSGRIVLKLPNHTCEVIIRQIYDL